MKNFIFCTLLCVQLSLLSCLSGPVVITFSGTNVSFSQVSPQEIDPVSEFTIAVTADTDFTRSDIITGTCPAGTWNGDTYTTHVVADDCTIVFTANVLESITLAPSAVSLNIDDTQQFAVAGTFDDETSQTLTEDLTWSTSDESIVAVSQDGVATAVAAGEAQITVTQIATDLSAAATVTVAAVDAGVSQYTVGGTTSGLDGTLVLQANGDFDLTLIADGDFTFDAAITDGEDFEVTVLTQPDGQTCTVVDGSGTVDGANVTSVSVTCLVNDTTLLASVSTLGLSVNDVGLNAALTGTPRLITITNTGVSSATDVTYSPSPALPSGTTISPASCGTIAASDTCVLTITPGATPSAAAGDTNPTPITLSISGINTNTLTPTVNILTYGSVYQGGYVYAVDDTTPDTSSVGGSVVTQTDQAPRFPDGVVWSSNGESSTSVSYDSIPGITETSTTGSSAPTYATAQIVFDNTYSNAFAFPFPSSGSFYACDGQTDGACNSDNILTLYDTYVTNYGIGGSPYTLSSGPTSASDYAAGLCTATISDYSDWYLPAICELGPNSNGSGCNVGTQNIVNQLPDLVGDPASGTPNTSCPYGANCIAGFYWSSTEDSGNPTVNTWYQDFASGGGSFQGGVSKDNLLGVRCSRALTE